MNVKRNIEIFSAGCPICEETIRLVNDLACPACDISVLDMREPQIADRAKALGIRTVPTVLVDGKPAGCCAGRGPEAASLRAAGIGQAA